MQQVGGIEEAMESHMPFHQILQSERNRCGLSQAELAEKVGVDEKTVIRWEAGANLPRPYARRRLSQILGKSLEALGLADTTPAKISEALPSTTSTGTHAEIEIPSPQTTASSSTEAPPTDKSSSRSVVQEDWGEAPRTGDIYGRTEQRDQLLQWLKDDSCHVIAIVGVGGIGKTTLASLAATRIRDTYPFLFWRSLHNAPPLEHILKSCIRFLSHQQQSVLPDTEDELLALLHQYLREHRCLLVLDDFESILQPQQRAGSYQKGYEGYGRLIQRLAEIPHSSCLLLTSRDKPREVAQREGRLSSVRSFPLEGVNPSEGRAILCEKKLFGSDAEWEELLRRYSGNPLALKLMAEPIQEIFDGSLSKFLADEGITFGDLSIVLEQQIQRLTAQERDILYWLAIEREAVSLEELRDDLLQYVQKSELVETLASLRRRSLIEIRQQPTAFTLQPVIMEYMITNLVKQFVEEFQSEASSTWTNYALLKTQAADYVRESQMRVLLQPVAQRLLDRYDRAELKHLLQEQLALLRQHYPLQHSYRAGNILNLLVSCGYDLRNLDFSHLMIRQAYLQNVLLPAVNFADAHFVAPAFTNTFGNILSVAFSPNGNLLAAGTATGDIWIYDTVHERQTALYTGHTDGVWAIAFSPDQQLLASSSDDKTIRVWNVSTGECLTVFNEHDDRVRTLAFHPEGKLLVSGSDDRTIRLWDVEAKQCVQILQEHTDRVWAVVIRNAGDILATGSTDQTIRLWHLTTRQCIAVLTGHTNSIRALSFHPDGSLLASASDDQTVRTWDIERLAEVRVFPGHTNRVWSVAYSRDGQWLASGSEDQTIRIWETGTERCIQTLHGHAHGVRSVVFGMRDLLASGGDDQTARLWNIRTGHCLRTFQGYTSRIWSVLFRPDGQQLLSSSEDGAIRVWDTYTESCIRTIEARDHGIRCLACSPDGMSCASGGEDQTIRLWHLATGQLHKTLRGHTDWIRAVAFHPDGHLLASGGEDRTVRLWDVHSGVCLHSMSGHSSWVRDIAFSFDGSTLATCGDDATIRLWNPLSGSPTGVLEGHVGRIRSIAFHPECPLLASGSEDQMIRLWDMQIKQCCATLEGHTGRIRSVAFSPDGQTLASSGEDNTIRLWSIDDMQCLITLHSPTRARWIAFHPHRELLASSGDDGFIRLWQLSTGQPVQTLISERPYERMNITNVRGLTPAQKETLRSLGAIEDI
jgi:WD40 repeat protein/transcriptional regulator with XRE-family HTH domain